MQHPGSPRAKAIGAGGREDTAIGTQFKAIGSSVKMPLCITYAKSN